MIAATSFRSLVLPTVPRDDLGNRNVLCRRRAPMSALWMDAEWMFEVGPARAAAPSESFVELDWGGARAYLGMSRASVGQLAGFAMPGDEPLEWPEPVMLAALEYAASELAQQVESSTRMGVRIVSIGERPASHGKLDAYGWRAWSEDRQLEGDLLLEETATRFLAAALRERPAVAADLDFDALPLRLRLVTGWVDLPANALRTLERRDVIVMDECLLSESNQLMLMLGTRLGVPCELRDSTLEVLEGVQEIMADVDDTVASANGLIDDVPVRLTFDLGEREISLGDLRSLQPGYLFNLGRDPKSTVSIRANGRLIGEGELVDIEGRVGVAVLQFGPASE